MMKPDPKLKRKGDGYVCALEGCGKPLTEIAFKHIDPFCSTKCCHEYHGVEVTMPGRGVLVASSI